MWALDSKNSLNVDRTRDAGHSRDAMVTRRRCVRAAMRDAGRFTQRKLSRRDMGAQGQPCERLAAAYVRGGGEAWHASRHPHWFISFQRLALNRLF